MAKAHVSAIDIVDHDSLLQYADKYQIAADVAQTIYNVLFLANPSLDNDDTFRFRLPANDREVNALGRREPTGDLIEVGVSNYRTHGIGNVTWIGIEGVNI